MWSKGLSILAAYLANKLDQIRLISYEQGGCIVLTFFMEIVKSASEYMYDCSRRQICEIFFLFQRVGATFGIL